MKKKRIFLSSALLVSAIVSWNYSHTEADNGLPVKTKGNISISMIDIYTRPKNDIHAGEKIKKNVRIENIGTNPAYIKIELERVWTFNGARVNDMNTEWIQPGTVSPTDWIIGNDGCYYYQYPLQPSETTSDLIDSFTLSPEYTNTKYPGIEGNIIVQGFAVQSGNFTPVRDKNNNIISWGDIIIGDITVTQPTYNTGNEITDSTAAETSFQSSITTVPSGTPPYSNNSDTAFTTFKPSDSINSTFTDPTGSMDSVSRRTDETKRIHSSPDTSEKGMNIIYPILACIAAFFGVSGVLKKK